ncbi:MAG: GIY-YIG nuclease family protein [Leptolyngbyaceae cyanobacterium CRU_2_3]|nr:GIY-YIG nuclease family protein [Leptolyngbyaceae cyanobacterium CRU_2_3]
MEIELHLAGIYCVVNRAAKRLYVGQTGLCIQRRWHQHKLSLLRGDHYSKLMQEDFNLYGMSAFNIFVLEVIKF